MRFNLAPFVSLFPQLSRSNGEIPQNRLVFYEKVLILKNLCCIVSKERLCRTAME